MKSAGHEIFRWEVGNEQDVLGLTSYISYFNAIADALHVVNANYLVGGPTTSKYGAFSTSAFVAGVTSARLGFLSTHSFDFPTNPTDNSVLYAKALSLNDAMQARIDLAGTGADAIPIMITGNLCPENTGAGAAINDGYAGMIGIALLIAKYFKTETLGKFWFALDNLYYSGAPQFTGDITELTPQGIYLHAAATMLLGNQVSVVNNLTNVDMLVTVSGKNFAIQFINYDLTGAKTANVALIGGLVTGTIARWEMGRVNNVMPLIGTAVLSAVALPAESIVILTGTLQ
jgi:hypothetical protein